MPTLLCRRMLGAAVLLMLVLLAACSDRPLNNPYRAEEAGRNILYGSFSERPKHLDPARSYNANEYQFLAQIYEPPLQYHYLKRPYTLIPATAGAVPEPRYYDARGQEVTEQSGDVAMTVYDIRIRPGVRYQPHPALARDHDGELLYRHLSPQDLEHIHALSDFARTGSREVTAADYVYQIKRLAHPHVLSPILGIMSEYIIGLADYAKKLDEVYTRQLAEDPDDLYLDLEKYPLAGVEVVDRYTYRIRVKGKYPQLLYWLAMPFFAPMPPEAVRFYEQPGMKERNLTLDWYPIGSGPYMLTVNDPNRLMVLEKNPEFHGESYPSEGEPGDREAGLLADAGRPMPFIDKVVFSLEKENIPYWNKFLQGYYDTSAITSDSFDQAVRIAGDGEVSLTDDMREKGIQLTTAVNVSTFYMGFNMLDPVVGGLSDAQRKLRQAVSIVMDYEEYISIFMNGRGIAAQGPIPPGIFGYRGGQAGIDPYVYDWRNGAARRKSMDEARRLLAEAGYPDGIDAKTGQPLTLHLDITAAGPDDKARLDWYRKQLKKLNIQLVVRNTDYNRFQDKMRNGKAQIFIWGWNADYPDPENFLFLLYGPNGKAEFHGENASNYSSPEYDRLFEQMKNMENSDQRQQIIDRMMAIVRRDAPWIWGLHPKSFSLYHQWYHNVKPNLIANNTLKYRRLDASLREQKRREWNRPVWWPVVLIGVVIIAILIPAVLTHIRREHRTPSLTGQR